MYIEVLVEITSKHVDKTFTYQVPTSLEKDIAVGKRVLIPFGNRTIEGYILSRKESSDIDAKEIIEVIDEEPVLDEEMMALGKFLQEKTLASLSSCYAAMLPKALKAKQKSVIRKKMQCYLKLTNSYEEVYQNVTSETQKQIVKLFLNNDILLKKEANKISPSGVKTLLKNGFLEEMEEEVYRYEAHPFSKDEKKILTKDQQIAYNQIKKGFNTSQVFLLHGVTGSGKTEVYLQLIESVLENGKTALVLVPEISLTPQLTKRFMSRFGGKIAVLHSGLSDAERYDEWRKILRKEVSIVIGARSAIFAPLKNIGIIVIDEEHSESYKQENNPRYHVLDVAKKRSELWNCPILLGSATPTLGSMARASKKVYQYIPLLKRANNQILPTVTTIDMAEEIKNRHSILSRELECKMIEKLNKKEQVLLLLNRRGHSTTITCSNCGYTYRCPYCDISLTFHKSSNQLRCHYCGYAKFKDDKCPNCHEDGLNYYGLGTEKLEEYLIDIFPTARIVRMDRDTTLNKGMYEKITNDFYEHKYDILLGTQMISKGLDFPDVSLVGILNADASMNIPDYRSNERTFSLLCQASGRAGRARTSGEVIIQTFYPDNYVIKCVQNQNYLQFYLYEMNIRRTLKYPPFYYLVCLTIKGKDYELTSTEARKAKNFLNNHFMDHCIILGPTTANMFLVNKVYHFEILIKYKKEKNLIQVLKELDKMFLVNKKVELDIDFYS